MKISPCMKGTKRSWRNFDLRKLTFHTDKRKYAEVGNSAEVSTGKTLFDAELLVRLHDDVLGEKLKSPHDWRMEKILLYEPN